jgi:hypothetical protein
MARIKNGTKVHLIRVSRKYACGKGIVVDHVKCYTDNVKSYPWLHRDHSMSEDVGVFTKPNSKRKPCGIGYVVDCYDSENKFRERIICTEALVREQYGIHR